MSASSSISVGWPIPENLKFSRTKSGIAGHKATFSWTDISPSAISSVDLSGGGFYDRWWRVMIDEKSYLVYNNPTFTFQIPSGPIGDKTCVKVQTIYDLSSVPYTFTDLATSEWCDAVCVPCDTDKYCNSIKCKTVAKTQNALPEIMRYSLAMRMGKYGSRMWKGTPM